MIDFNNKSNLVTTIKQESDYGPVGVGVMMQSPNWESDPEVNVVRWACLIDRQDVGMELNDLKLPKRGSVKEVADAIKRFLQDHRVKDGARRALESLEESLRDAVGCVRGSEMLSGSEVNQSARIP